MWIFYDDNGPVTIKYGVGTFHYVTNLQGDVVAIVGKDGQTAVEYTYDAWGKVTSITGVYAYNLGIHNPILYRGYVYDHETGLYYCQSRYYDPEIGRFINADTIMSTGQGFIGNNMFAYCGNNPVNHSDPTGHLPLGQFAYACLGNNGYIPPNIEYLMAFYDVDSPSEVPKMPDGAMIFVENITSFTFIGGVGVVEGRTIVMDANRYCEYTFIGIGYSISKSIPLDRTITQGYVYGLEDVQDYCGLFVGGSSNMLSTMAGGAYASSKVYAEIVGGMSYAPSIGGSITYYTTGQTDWIYGRANMTIVTNPYQKSWYDQFYPRPYA